MADKRVAIVTGGGTGIGAACARALAESCTDLVLVGRRMDRLESAAATITDARVHLRSVDLTDVAAVSELCDWAKAEFGTIDIVVNNAGSPAPRSDGRLEAIAAAWESTWRANTLSVVLVTEGLKDAMSRPGGRIIIIGSFASELGTGTPAYACAKGALETYAMTLTRELGPEGITSNVVSPGYTEGTELLAGRMTPERHERLIAGIAVRRPGTPEEIAGLVAYLASHDAGFITGQTIIANGGTYLSA